MDDLWGNAWGSPDDLKDEGKLTTTTWSPSEKSRNDDPQEDDLSMPSWSTGPGIQWDEPSNIQSSLWSNVHHTTQDWSLENPYADIPLGTSRPPELPNEKDTVGEPAVGPQSHSLPSSPPALRDDIHPPSPSVGLDDEVSHSPTPPSTPSPEPSPSSSPDAFGTFTVGTEHSDATPFPTIRSPIGGGLDDNEWNSPWGGMPKDADTGSAEGPSDEWESAKLRQLEMDRRVPPELLSQILLHLEELTKEAWSENQDEVEEGWQRRWNSGMDVDGIESILLRYIPALTLPQLLPPSRSFIGKAMADAVKLSRNTTLARTSPMSTFLAAKGSTAWETSVKSRLETPSDEVPLGWRILEKDQKKDEKAEEKLKKQAGLLAGFWGRRTSNPPSNPPVLQQSTLSPNSTAPESDHPVPTQNQHSSMDGAKTPSGTPPTSQTLPKPFHERTSSQDDDTHTPPSGSAVSRFLQRFSRPRASSSSPRNSLALSSDDLEFLSDVRSKSNDPSQTIDVLIAGLEGETEGTESSTLYGKLPPPLPPPPKVSSSLSHGPTAPPRGNRLNGNTLVPLGSSPDDPVANLVSDLQGLTERPSISALTPLTPSPTRAVDSDSPQSMSPHSLLYPSHPLSLDENPPSLSLSAFSLLSSQPGPAFSSPSDSQPQLPLASVSTTQSFAQDDDDFSDFRSSPADPPLLPLDVSSSLGKVPFSQSSHRQSSSPFGDLVHLMSSPPTGPPNTFEEPDVTPLFSFASPDFPTAPGLPKLQVSAYGNRASLDRPDTAPATPEHSRSNSQLRTSPPKATPTSPKQKMITQGHQRTQSLLDLAAARRGRWPAPPSPLPEPLAPPPPPAEKGQGGGVTNVDYFGATTPTDESTNLPPPPPPGKYSLMPSLGNTTTPWVDSSTTRVFSPAPSLFDAFAQPRSGSPGLALSAPPVGQSTRRVALSPPPRPTAIMNNNSSSRPPSSPSTPVPLLPPPSGYRLAAPSKPSPAVPLAESESTPLALLMGNNEGTKIGLPAAKATPPPPPVKGAGGLSAQDLSFFEGL